ncbi:MAG: hypothetical protein MJ134_08910 [Lachnospiraceae bacterium]|nr:hypothetical protein [Lachnospiraceae bacterium]
MKEKDNWERFLATGKIQDYLQYKAVENSVVKQTEEKEKRHAGVGYRDRNGSAGGTFRGV